MANLQAKRQPLTNRSVIHHKIIICLFIV